MLAWVSMSAASGSLSSVDMRVDTIADVVIESFGTSGTRHELVYDEVRFERLVL